MSDIEKLKSKIKKLLALSKSPNPNEAASALKMAQELMAEYKVDQDDLNSFEITEETTKTARRNTPPRYEWDLFYEISVAFGCKVIHDIKSRGCAWRYIGLRHRAQVSAYIGQVLLRKLRSARAEYIKTLYRVRSRHRKTQRADDFCNAWVSTVTRKLSVFAGLAEEEQKAVDFYVAKNYPNLRGVNPTSRSFGNPADYYNGHRAGEGVQLQHGVGADPRSSRLLGA